MTAVHFLEIADLGVRLDLLDDEEPPGPRFEPFAALSRTRVDVVLRQRLSPPDERSSWQYHREKVLHLWQCGDGEFEFQRVRDVSINPPYSHTDLALDTGLRVILARFLATRGGLLLHASGWRRDRTAAVFFGMHGAGKSTTVRSAATGEYLCDDGIIIRASTGGWRAYGTPFRGTDGRPGSPGGGALHGLYALRKQAGPPVIRRLEQLSALKQLMRCVMLHDETTVEREGSLDTATRLVRDGWVRELALGLGTNPWDALADWAN
ncbi:MAG: hypothetical protein AB2A00_36025 [Myxococcota bacterium]